MDLEAKKQQLENEKAALENYFQHPVTVEVLRRIAEEEEELLKSFLHLPVVSLESFFNREQAIGHLRGLRSIKASLTESLEDVKQQLKEL